MKFFESEEALENAFKAFVAGHKSHLGLISQDVPLISNLPVWSNIALIRQYHENTHWHEAKALALAMLERFGITSTAEKRSPSLTAEERFCIMLIRAAMVRNGTVALNRPFLIFPDLPDGRFIIAALRKLDDLIAEAYIFDYNWEKERYGKNDDAEN